MLSVEGQDVWATVVLLTVLAAPVAAFVYGVGFYSLVAWRQTGDAKSDEPPPETARRCGATAGSTILGWSSRACWWSCCWSGAWPSWPPRTPPHPNSLQVDVTGQQWLWTFSYPGAGNVQTRSLVLPDNRTIVFHVTSEDVTHGFWPVELGVQVDANPNVVTRIQATTNKLGAFTVRCSQLCGLYHSFMYASGAVVTPTGVRRLAARAGGLNQAAADAGVRHDAPSARSSVNGRKERRDHSRTAALEDTPLGPRPAGSTGTRTS